MSDLSFAACEQADKEWKDAAGAPASDDPGDHAPQTLRREVRYNRLLFSVQAAALDLLAICSAFALASFAYNLIVHGAYRAYDDAQLGLMAAVLFVAFNFSRHAYLIGDYLDLSGHAERVFSLWNYAFLAAATAGFMLRAIGDSSRGSFIVFYFVGLCALYASRAALVIITKRHAERGDILTARVLIVGYRAQISSSIDNRKLARSGVEIVSTLELDDGAATLESRLADAVDAARLLMPDDIVLVAPLEKSDVLERCITAFMRVPAALHLHVDANSPLHRFLGPQFKGGAAISSFRLPADSMSAVGAAAKRLCDIVLSLAALILLAPLLLLVAIAIKIDSSGPVLYFQSRHGFNKERFRIVKFRSMRTTEEGPSIRQAVENDPRVTHVGRVLRRFNIDELPQLLNVLRGEMSLVGPRPHALVHDMAFETEISLYARRHNVKPGITGWAQVNGFRGETNTPDKIWQRVHYDLHYIDNWSLAFDIWIMCLTLLSRKAYSNAH